MRFFTLILIILLLGCSTISRIGYGAKKQKIENEQAIKDWLSLHDFPTDYVISVAPEYYYEFIPGLSQAPLLFDAKSGSFLAIGFANGKYCPKETDKSFSTILPYPLLKEKPDSFLIAETIEIPKGGSISDSNSFIRHKDTLHLSLSILHQKIKSLSGASPQNLTGEEDYILIIPFAIFLGNKVQVSEIKKYYLSARRNRYATIKIVFLNLDKQEWWGKEWNQKIKIE